MESAALGVVLDSSVLIDAERQRLDVARFLRHIQSCLGQREVALCSISVAELAHGIYRANTPERMRVRRVFLDDLKASMPVYAITSDTAELVGKINGEASSQGQVIPFDDLLIGACALEHGYAVATRNPRHFRLIPGLTIIQM